MQRLWNSGHSLRYGQSNIYYAYSWPTCRVRGDRARAHCACQWSMNINWNFLAYFHFISLTHSYPLCLSPQTYVYTSWSRAKLRPPRSFQVGHITRHSPSRQRSAWHRARQFMQSTHCLIVAPHIAECRVWSTVFDRVLHMTVINGPLTLDMS